MNSKEFFSLNSAVPSKELIGTGARQVRTTTDLSQIRLSDSFPSFKQQVGHAKSPPDTTWADHVFLKRYPGTLKAAQAMSGKLQLIAV